MIVELEYRERKAKALPLDEQEDDTGWPGDRTLGRLLEWGRNPGRVRQAGRH